VTNGFQLLLRPPRNTIFFPTWQVCLSEFLFVSLERRMTLAARVSRGVMALGLAIIFSVGLLSAQQSQPAQRSLSQNTDAAPAKHKLGPFEISINWRTRSEGWNWFEGKTGNSDYGLWDSLLRVGIGQTRE
jgi:hypothetical protein